MSNLKVTGKIDNILEVQKGTSKAGKEWEKISFVINTNAEYNPLICFQVFGVEKVAEFQKKNNVGDLVDVFFNVSSREYDNKYYHNIDCWKIETIESFSAVGIGVENEDEDIFK